MLMYSREENAISRERNTISFERIIISSERNIIIMLVIVAIRVLFKSATIPKKKPKKKKQTKKQKQTCYLNFLFGSIPIVALNISRIFLK